MTKIQACEPCSKRKVRCDRGEPCTNCKRRKQDYCIYPDASPFDRIKRLEAIIRALGGDPKEGIRIGSTRIETAPSEAEVEPYVVHEPEDTSFAGPRGKDNDAIVLEEDGQAYYLESHTWSTHFNNTPNAGAKRAAPMRNPFLARNHPNALQGILCNNRTIDFTPVYPRERDATILWETFKQRVNPVLRISFSWDLDRVHAAALDLESCKQLSEAENAFLFSVYLISTFSLSEDECEKKLAQPRAILLSEFQVLFEEAVARTGLLCINNIIVLKALTLYLVVGIERFSTQSMWSLMGLLIRNAEKLGIHRDGTFLGLTPLETEERRRLWWQLQHLDIGLAVRAGITPLTLTAEWDAKLPLNIEDDDINASMKDFPKERKGLTSMSYSLYTFWVVEQQRNRLRASKGHFSLSWQSDRALPEAVRDSIISALEEGLNTKFLQFCDPIKPLDALLQLSARALICVLRQRMMQASASKEQLAQPDSELRVALLKICMQSLEYNIVGNVHPAIKRFKWLTEQLVPWHSFMWVLIEASQQHDKAQTALIWDLLAEFYAANRRLSMLSDDRRSAHAAELVVGAWKGREKSSQSDERLSKPEFVTELESQLLNMNLTFETEQNPGTLELPTPESLQMDQSFDTTFDLDFQDIDWSFWNSMD